MYLTAFYRTTEHNMGYTSRLWIVLTVFVYKILDASKTMIRENYTSLLLVSFAYVRSFYLD